MDEVTRAYQLLGLNAPASEDQIKQAYRDMVKVWHPDRFAHDARLQQTAQEKLKEINGAYEILLASLFAQGTTVEPGAPPKTETTGTPAAAGPRVAPGRAMTVFLLLCLAVSVGWWALHPQGHVADMTPGSVSENSLRLPPTNRGAAVPPSALNSQTRPELPPGELIANRVITVADDFVVDIFLNGRRVDDSERREAGEIYGATVEDITLDVHEGDWLVFNVVNNRFRWDGSYYFGVAGVNEDGAVAFVSDLKSGRWSCCDDPGDVPRFIAEADYMATNAVHEVSHPWDQGTSQMQNSVKGWSGVPIWGTNQNTWIKYRAPRVSQTK